MNKPKLQDKYPIRLQPQDTALIPMGEVISLVAPSAVTDDTNHYDLLSEIVCEGRSIAPATRKQYITSILHFIRWVIDQKPGTLSITTSVYARYREWIAEHHSGERGWSSSYRNEMLRGAKMLLQFLHRHGVIVQDVTAGIRAFPLTRKTERPIISDEDVEKIFEQIKGQYRDKAERHKMTVLFCLLIYQGFRISTIMNAQWGGVSLYGKKPSITVATKGERQDVYTLHRETVKALRNYKKTDILNDFQGQRPIIDNRGDRIKHREQIKRMCNNVMIVALGHTMFHALRSYSITQAIKNVGVEGARLHAGHADVKVTLGYTMGARESLDEYLQAEKKTTKKRAKKKVAKKRTVKKKKTTKKRAKKKRI